MSNRNNSMAGIPTDNHELSRASLWHQLGHKLQKNWKSVVIFIPFFWLLLFFLAPFFIVLKISLSEATIASPPYLPMISWLDEGIMQVKIVFDNFAYLWEDDLYIHTYVNSVRIAGISTFICLLMIILPFWTSFLLRVYAWMGLLADQGSINDLLIYLGIIDEPIRLLYTQFAVYVGIIYTYLPFMILPLYANMEKLDLTLLEAASDLGARPITTFLTVTLPLTIPGIVAGSLLVFIPATGEYVIPDLLGGGNVLMIGRVLYNEFAANFDWPVASAVAIALLLVLVLPMMLYQRIQAQEVEVKQ
jgi:putrescine transport system permease protein